MKFMSVVFKWVNTETQLTFKSTINVNRQFSI